MSSGTVLILEDSRVQAAYISRMLAALDWSAVVSFDYKMASSLLKTTRVDLMLLDVFIGNDNTVTHMPEIREIAPHIPVCFMTAGGQGGSVLNATLNMARKAQADFVLPKPFGPEHLNPILAEALSMRRAPVRPKHVLVIDDCRVVRKVATMALAEKNYRISEAPSMEAALDSVDIAHVDVVLTDIFMPGMGGIEGINIIKKTWPAVSIIAMSAGAGDKAASNTQVLSAARHIGAHALLPKPFGADDLTGLIEAVLMEKAEAA